MKKIGMMMLVAVFCLVFSVSTYAQPLFPEWFYGNVLVENATNITAMVDNVLVSSTLVIDGTYGYGNNTLIIENNDENNPLDGETVYFFVDDIEADQTAIFTAGTATELNLTTDGTGGGEGESEGEGGEGEGEGGGGGSHGGSPGTSDDNEPPISDESTPVLPQTNNLNNTPIFSEEDDASAFATLNSKGNKEDSIKKEEGLFSRFFKWITGSAVGPKAGTSATLGVIFILLIAGVGYVVYRKK